MAAKPRVKPTRATRRVLLVLLTGASNLSGLVICRAAGTRAGTIHLVLARLEGAGWAAAERWESYHGQPLGYRYRLTEEGRRQAMSLLGLADGRA